MLELNAHKFTVTIANDPTFTLGSIDKSSLKSPADVL